jgi:hypothetical protein
MKTIAYNIFATLAIASAVNAEMLTFESLPTPTVEVDSDLKVAAMPRMYEGFSFTSLVGADNDFPDIFDNRWGYYKMRPNTHFGGFDEGIIGSRAVFTPWGAGAQHEFAISRADQFIFDGAFICQVNQGEDDFTFDGDGRDYSMLTVTGWIGDTAVYAFSTQIEYAVGSYLSFNNGIAVDRVTFSTDTGAAISLDNFTFTNGAVPAPSVLALLGLAGIVARRSRN